MSDDKPSYKGYVNRKWISTPQTRRNHEAIFKKVEELPDQDGVCYPKHPSVCDCTGEHVDKLSGRICQDCGKFTEYGVDEVRY